MLVFLLSNIPRLVLNLTEFVLYSDETGDPFHEAYYIYFLLSISLKLIFWNVIFCIYFHLAEELNVLAELALFFFKKLKKKWLSSKKKSS